MAPGILSSDILSGIYSDKFNLTFFLAFGKITWPQNPSPYQVSPNHHLPFCQGQCLDFERHLWSHDFDPWLWDCKTKSTLSVHGLFGEPERALVIFRRRLQADPLMIKIKKLGGTTCIKKIGGAQVPQRVLDEVLGRPWVQ